MKYELKFNGQTKTIQVELGGLQNEIKKAFGFDRLLGLSTGRKIAFSAFVAGQHASVGTVHVKKIK